MFAYPEMTGNIFYALTYTRHDEVNTINYKKKCLKHIEEGRKLRRERKQKKKDLHQVNKTREKLN